ncbi:MAG: NAD(P)H-dependent oxidoreductase [Verrucomicrobiota bacterium]
MTPIADSQLLAALNWRYATKKFDPAKKIPASTWETLEQALILAPSSYGLQPWKFVVVTDPAVKQRLTAVSWGQTQAADCSHFVVFAFQQDVGADDVNRLITRTVAVRGGPAAALDGYKNFMLQSLAGAKTGGTLDTWQSRQVYIALGQFMAAAALLGVEKRPHHAAGLVDEDAVDEVLENIVVYVTEVISTEKIYLNKDSNTRL